jgi:hypothetical protein
MVAKEYNKYVVFKREELEVVLGNQPLLKRYFDTISSLVELYRITLRKKPYNNYIVCNQDEPYADKVWKLILDGEKAKEEEHK